MSVDKLWTYGVFAKSVTGAVKQMQMEQARYCHRAPGYGKWVLLPTLGDVHLLVRPPPRVSGVLWLSFNYDNLGSSGTC